MSIQYFQPTILYEHEGGEEGEAGGEQDAERVVSGEGVDEADVRSVSGASPYLAKLGYACVKMAATLNDDRICVVVD